MNLSSLAVTLFKRLARFQYRDVGISVEKQEFYCVNITVTLSDGISLKSSGLDSSFSMALIKALTEIGEHYLVVVHKLGSSSGIAGGLTSYTAKKRAEWELIERMQVDRLISGETSVLKIGVDKNMDFYQFVEQINGAKIFLGFFSNGDYQNFTAACDSNESNAIEHMRFVLMASARDLVFSYDVAHIQKVVNKLKDYNVEHVDHKIFKKIKFKKFNSPLIFFRYFQAS